jgi:hypothetical protein
MGGISTVLCCACCAAIQREQLWTSVQLLQAGCILRIARPTHLAPVDTGVVLATNRVSDWALQIWDLSQQSTFWLPSQLAVTEVAER